MDSKQTFDSIKANAPRFVRNVEFWLSFFEGCDYSYVLKDPKTSFSEAIARLQVDKALGLQPKSNARHWIYAYRDAGTLLIMPYNFSAPTSARDYLPDALNEKPKTSFLYEVDDSLFKITTSADEKSQYNPAGKFKERLLYEFFLIEKADNNGLESGLLMSEALIALSCLELSPVIKVFAILPCS